MFKHVIFFASTNNSLSSVVRKQKLRTSSIQPVQSKVTSCTHTLTDVQNQRLVDSHVSHTKDPTIFPILERRKKRLSNDLSQFLYTPHTHLNSKNKCRRRPDPIRIGHSIHPVDFINKKVRGTYRLDGAMVAAYANTLRPVLFPEVSMGKNNLQEIFKQKEENTIISEKKSLLHHEMAYVNSICLEMDKKLLSLSSIEDVLSHVISHRGVFYVHNLITAIQLIAILSTQSSTQEILALDNDDRLQLLLDDLKENRCHLDLVALVNVLISLQRLGIKNYLVFNAFLERILFLKFKSESTTDLLHAVRTIQLYQWAGYTDGLLYDYCSHSLENGCIYLNKELLVQGCRVIGSVNSHHIAFFKSVQNWLLDPNCPFGLSVPNLWESKDIAVLCEALTRHGRHEYDLVLTAINDHIVQHINDYKSKELITCLRGFRIVNLSFPETALAVSERVGKELYTAVATHTELTTISISRLCFFVDSISYFGYDGVIIQDAVRHVCKYLTERIDVVHERSAIRICWSIVLYGLSGEFSDLLFFLYRQIGRTVAWEKESVRIYQLWCSQMLQFPSMDYDMKASILYESYRQWVILKGGFRTAFLDEVEEVSSYLLRLGVDHTVEKELDAPYTIDIAFERSRKALYLVNECARNDHRPTGTTLLQFTHLRLLGWEPSSISIDFWNTLQSDEKMEFLRSLLEQYTNRVVEYQNLQIKGMEIHEIESDEITLSAEADEKNAGEIKPDEVKADGIEADETPSYVLPEILPRQTNEKINEKLLV